MYLVFYDISSEKIRGGIVKNLKNIGMQRLQKSIFIGDVKKRYIEEITTKNNRFILEENDSLIILKLDIDFLKKIEIFGKDINIENYVKKYFVEII